MSVLTKRELNRATLARQMLLERATAAPYAAIERLGALQAQVARSPFVALWSRLADLDAAELRDEIARRRVVKSTLMRATLHLTSDRDYLAFRPALQASLARLATGMAKRGMGAVDADRLLEIAREFFIREPRTFAELFAHLEERFPGADTRALGYVVRLNMPLVVVPAEHRWSFPTSPARFTPASQWIGRAVPSDGPADALVLRYIGALGPATVADIANWTGLRAVRDVIGRLRSKLVTFEGEDGKELFDLPDAPRPRADTPAPVRFLPEFDNVVLSGADRSRFLTKDQQRTIFSSNLAYASAFLVDGTVAGAWRFKDGAITIEPFDKLTKHARDEVKDEAGALLAFLEAKGGVTFG